MGVFFREDFFLVFFKKSRRVPGIDWDQLRILSLALKAQRRYRKELGWVRWNFHRECELRLALV